MSRQTKSIFFRDPKYFEVILSFLRTFQWTLPPNMDESTLVAEAEFYMLKVTEVKQTKRKLPNTTDPTLKNGLYKHIKLHHYILIMNDYCLTSTVEPDEDTERSLLKITASDKNSIVISIGYGTHISGLYMNDYQSLILVYGVNTYLLDKCAPDAPTSTKKVTIMVPGVLMYIIIEFGENGAKILRKKTAVEVLVPECPYTTDAATGLLCVAPNIADLNVKAYIFGNDGAVVNLKGNWYFSEFE